MPWGRGAILPRSSWVYSDRQLLQKQRLANAWFKHCILHYKNHLKKRLPCDLPGKLG